MSASLHTAGQLVMNPHLPLQPTPFTGRYRELNELRQLFSEADCRLLTLLGPGGVGKTRLAQQMASTLADRFAHGTYFVDLQPLTACQHLATAIANSLHCALAGSREPDAQLCAYLAGKQTLLLLDNYEHLLPDTDLVSRLLSAAPGLKILVTSREVLNIQEEWLYPLQGLDVPADETVNDPDIFSAMQLFCERARRVRREFCLKQELAGVVRICRMVEGMPLALELAAVWTKTLSCERIAAEIQHNLDFLTTSVHNLPERHRSMRAIFDQSWRLLNPEERRVFMELSVFQGDFSAEAAEKVTQTTLPILSSLVDKSLLYFNRNGRYQMHELLRQYVAEKLAESPENTRTYERYCAYFADFLHRRREDLDGGRQRQALLEIDTELDNIRIVWQRAVAEEQGEALDKMAVPLYRFNLLRSRFRDGLNQFEQALQHPWRQDGDARRDLVLAQIMYITSVFYLRTGRLQQMQGLIEETRTLITQIDTSRVDIERVAEVERVLVILQGILANTQGNYREATHFGVEAHRLAEAVADAWTQALAIYIQTNAAFAQGQYEEARRYARQAYQVAATARNRWFQAYILNDLGNIERVLGNYAEAEQHYQNSYILRKEFDDPEGMAVALNHLARIALHQGQYGEAEQLFWRAAAIYKEVGDQGGLASACHGLGQVSCALENYETAQAHLGQALQITSEMQFVPLLLVTLITVAELLIKQGQAEQSIALLVLVEQHPGSDGETKARAQAVLANHSAVLPPDVVAAAHSRRLRLEDVLPEIMDQFQVVRTRQQPPPQANPYPSPFDQPLIEPLSGRELEVLRLLAAGCSNREIARQLVVTLGTVKSHVHNICVKLDVQRRGQAVARGRELHLL